MIHSYRSITLYGTVYGPIWQPGIECSMPVTADADAWLRSRCETEGPSARELALEATDCGDFQHCELTADSYFEFSRRTDRTNENGRIIASATRRRFVPVSAFPSIADMVGEKESYELGEGGE